MPSGSKKINVLIGADTRELNKALEKTSRKLNRFGRQMSLAGTDLMRTVTVPVTLAGGALLKFGGELDATKRAMTTVMGSAKLAKQEFLALKEAAKAPGLEFNAAIQGSLRFQSMGLSAEKARRTLVAFGNAVSLSGGGATEFSRTIQQLSDMFSRNKVTMEDWRRVQTAVPSVTKAMREEFEGMTDAVKIAQEVGFDEFMERLTRRLIENGGAGDSLRNSIQNLGSSLRHAAGELGILVAEGSGLTTWINKAVQRLDKFAVKLSTNEEYAKKVTNRVILLSKALVAIAGVGVIMKAVGALFLLAGAFERVAIGINTVSATMLGLNFAKLGPMARGAVAGSMMKSDLLFGASATAFMGKSLSKLLLGAVRLISWAGIAYAIVKYLGESITKGAAQLALKIGPAFAKAYSKLQPQDTWSIMGIEGRTSGSFIRSELAGPATPYGGTPEEASRLLSLMKGGSLLEHEIAEKRKKQKAVTDALTKISSGYNEALNELNATLAITGDENQALKDKFSLLESTLIDLKAAGLDGTKMFKDLMDQLRDVGLELAILDENFSKIEDSVFKTKDKNPYGLDFIDEVIGADADVSAPKLGGMAGAGGYMSGAERMFGVVPTEEEFDLANEKAEKLAKTFGQVQGIAQTMGGAFANAFEQVITGAQSFGDAMKGILMDLVKRVIKAIVAFAILKALMKLIPGFGQVTGATDAANIAQGIKLGSVLMSALGGGMFSAANGGKFSSMSPTMLGDYTNAYNKPELAGRVDQWAGLIEQFMGKGYGQQGETVTRVRGEDLLLVVERAINSRNRRGGGLGGLSLSN